MHFRFVSESERLIDSAAEPSNVPTKANVPTL
jgi:hypothetical protein